MELDEYQAEANRTDQLPGDSEKALAYPLMGLASEVGSLVNQFKKRVRDGEGHDAFSERASEELGDVLWYVANLAEKLGFSLEEVADENLRRIRERWPDSSDKWTPLDAQYPVEEQLPRQMTIEIAEVDVEGNTMVRLTRDGAQLGNELTDMNYDDDGYRFHDVFHLGYAALLGWSPIVRHFLKVRRESDSVVRTVEDGGRGGVIEEAVSAVVFNYARDAKFFDGVQHVDYELLRTIKGLVGHLEVRIRTAAEWQAAILKSYEVWRQVRAARSGRIHMNLETREFDYEALDT